MRRLRIAAGLLMLWASSAQAVAHDAGPGSAAAAPAAPAWQRREVLVIFGDDPSQPWIQPMSDGISRVLYGRGAESREAYYEYLDAVRFPDSAHRDLFRDTIRTKYRGIRFRLIVPVAGAAIRFVEAVRGSAVVEISVRDSGPGIPMQLSGRLFEPFVTTKPNGLGLGLSIVSSIVAAHGGTIGSHNAAEGGAVFSITLPHTKTA